METLLFPFVNLSALLVLLAVFLRKPLSALVVSRHETIRNELQSSREALLTAHKQTEDLNLRVQGMDLELSQVREQTRAEGERTRSAILDTARKLGAQILGDANAAAGALKAEFRGAVRRELATLAVSRAESRLRDRLTGEDHARIRQEFSTLVEKTQ